MKRTLAVLAFLAIAALPFAARALDLSTPAPDMLRLTLSQTTTVSATAAPHRTTIFGLPQNIGPVERVLRGTVAATLVGVAAYRLANDSPKSGLSYALLGIAAVPAATGATGYCPLYQLLGIDNTF
ncbi:MAG: DUF2892 domain-containing protein [Anaeromyxobacteraceae bacterium]